MKRSSVLSIFLLSQHLVFSLLSVGYDVYAVKVLPIRNGTAVGPDMHFLLKVNWQIFRILLFYDYFFLSEDLVIKVERVLLGLSP
jgi:hypothetical protein